MTLAMRFVDRAFPRLSTGLALLLAAVVVAAAPAQGEVARQIDWDDLLPAVPEPEDPLADLPEDLRYKVDFVASMRYLRRMGEVTEGDPAIDAAAEYAELLDRRGVDVDGYVRRYDAFRMAIEEIDNTLNESLDGTVVRIPGYLLPLDFEGLGVREFLLVPYVGACIHVPPPPQNQIVHVDLEEPFLTDSLFTPVWVTGRITAERSAPTLSLVDGQSPVPVGYMLRDGDVSPYEE